MRSEAAASYRDTDGDTGPEDRRRPGGGRRGRARGRHGRHRRGRRRPVVRRARRGVGRRRRGSAAAPSAGPDRRARRHHVGAGAVRTSGLPGRARFPRGDPHGDRRHLRGDVGVGPREGMGSRRGVDGGASRHRLLRLDDALPRPVRQLGGGCGAARRLRPRPAGRAGRAGGTGPAPGRDPGGGSPPPGRRGTGADRPRPPRLGRPHAGQHLGAGRGRRPRAGRTAQGCQGRTSRHQAHQPRRAGRAAGDAGHAPLGRHRAPRTRGRARPAALTHRELTCHGAPGRPRDRG